LEVRFAPVVGAFADAPAVARGTGYDGVALLEASDGALCSGELLSTGRHLLTAAHCLTGDNGALGRFRTNVTFQLLDGTTPQDITIPVVRSDYRVDPSYDGDVSHGYDVGVLTLGDPLDPRHQRQMIAPYGAERYSLYTASDEIGQVFTVVGYGRVGTGADGSLDGSSGVKHLGTNRFDADAHLLSTPPFSASAPPAGTALAWDFDNGQAANDAFGSLYGLNDLGLGAAEANPAQGDSGGPLFLNHQVAGIVSYSDGGISPPDVDTYIDRGFGEFGVATRVSAFRDFINSATGGRYDLVLDMHYQLLGVDGKREDLTIAAQRNDANLDITVSGAGNVALNGVYYSAPLADIRSLTLRGADDNEHFQIGGDLGFRVTVQGGAGKNELSAPSPTNTYIVTGNQQGTLNDRTIVFSSIQDVTSDTGQPLRPVRRHHPRPIGRPLGGGLGPMLQAGD
jgi:secreted trypsin-like serine protease